MSDRPQRRWLTRTIAGIVASTFLSDAGHEMVTAILPMHLASLGFGAGVLGLMEGLADFLSSTSKLLGGYVGHRTTKKGPLGALGYALTAVGVTSLALATSAFAFVALRCFAWTTRGFRGPLRDALLADEVKETHFGRAFGFERTADMLGAVTGPLIAFALLGLGAQARTIILWSAIPSFGAAAFFFFLAHDRPHPDDAAARAAGAAPPAKLGKRFYEFLVGVVLFGLGDFSRTFLVLVAARALAKDGGDAVPYAVLLYAFHNLVAAAVAYPAGRLGDRFAKMPVLFVGYGVGLVTNVILAFGAGDARLVTLAIVLSGVYVAMLETLEKATVATFLASSQRSLGFGVLGTANAAGDMISSVAVGWMLTRGDTRLAFGLPAAVSSLGVVWLVLRFGLFGRGDAEKSGTIAR